MRINILILLLAAFTLFGCEENSEPEEDDFSGTSGTFTDARDGEEYNWVKIGDQIWMAENLAYLPSVSPPWDESNIEPYYYVYDYDEGNVSEAKATSNYETYGVLYNWPAAMDACPDGWLLPTDDEWKQLEMCIGMSQNEADNIGYRGIDEGYKLKAISGWSENGSGNNVSGFTALPAGIIGTSRTFSSIGYTAGWWASSDKDESNAMTRCVTHDPNSIYRDYYKKSNAYSVRCVKDN